MARNRDQRSGRASDQVGTPNTQRQSGDPIDQAINDAQQPTHRRVGGRLSSGDFQLVAPVEMTPMDILSLINLLMNWQLKQQDTARSRIVIPTPVIRQ